MALARGRLVLVTGGARSGKSTFAERLALQSGKQVIYIATCLPGDEEMRQRIEEHRCRRPPSWTTVEEPLDPASIMGRYDNSGRCFLLDCLTLLVSNHLLRAAGQEGERVEPGYRDVGERVLALLGELASAVEKLQADAVLVTNEVGMGLVPEWPLGRLFRDLAGRANQCFAALADEVYLMVCGIPLQVK
ncbi:MAG TPA: bifunctional adenosylcobinamide kinase/adenosylcobinamide-phosphate guanylyltransferase [Firmicutes bacterium]|nr:bifunctional adenosylcobinamide kinase/adenosylcobinamide-phosphate guanylyltransferase [Bacillota bacterium]